jgi:hypothetical protein
LTPIIEEVVDPGAEAAELSFFLWLLNDPKDQLSSIGLVLAVIGNGQSEFENKDLEDERSVVEQDVRSLGGEENKPPVPPAALALDKEEEEDEEIMDEEEVELVAPFMA